MDIPVCYRTGHIFADTIAEAFAEGCGGRLAPAVTLLQGNAFFYGILRGTGEILRQCEKAPRHYLHCDHGYFGRSDHQRGRMDGYYRITLNGQSHRGIENASMDRFRRHNIELKKWQKGRHILVLPISTHVAKFEGISSKAWLDHVVSTLGEYSDRDIEIKLKGDGNLQEALKDCHAVVGFQSNALVEAVIAGVPAFDVGRGCTRDLGNTSLMQIEQPVYEDRLRWLSTLAYRQFSLEEMRNGYAWEEIQQWNH